MRLAGGKARSLARATPATGLALALCLLLADPVRQVEAHADEVPKQPLQACHVAGWQRRAQNRGDVAAQVCGAAGAEQDHVDAGLMPGEAVGRVDDVLGSTGVQQEPQRVGGVDGALLELALGDQIR